MNEGWQSVSVAKNGRLTILLNFVALVTVISLDAKFDVEDGWLTESGKNAEMKNVNALMTQLVGETP